MIYEIIAKSFDKLSIYEKISLRYFIIQLVEAAAASVCIFYQIFLMREQKDILTASIDSGKRCYSEGFS